MFNNFLVLIYTHLGAKGRGNGRLLIACSCVVHGSAIIKGSAMARAQSSESRGIAAAAHNPLSRRRHASHQPKRTSRRSSMALSAAAAAAAAVLLGVWAAGLLLASAAGCGTTPASALNSRAVGRSTGALTQEPMITDLCVF
jgi:hypothetical protein